MTRIHAWDDVWRQLDAEGIPTTQFDVNLMYERGDDPTVAENLVAEMDQLAAMKLPRAAIELIGYAVLDAYRLGAQSQ